MSMHKTSKISIRLMDSINANFWVVILCYSYRRSCSTQGNLGKEYTRSLLYLTIAYNSKNYLKTKRWKKKSLQKGRVVRDHRKVTVRLYTIHGTFNNRVNSNILG